MIIIYYVHLHYVRRLPVVSLFVCTNTCIGICMYYNIYIYHLSIVTTFTSLFTNGVELKGRQINKLLLLNAKDS
jgi:hypothetical protein